MTGQRGKCLHIVVEDTDRYGEEKLYDAIVRYLFKQGIAGATAWEGHTGFGAHGRIHRPGLFGVSDERPVVITAFDSEEKLREVMPTLVAMVENGVVALIDAEIFVPSQPTE